MARPARREEPLERLGIVRVVEDQQPAGGGNPAPEQVDRLLGGGRHVLAGLRAQPHRQLRQGRDHVVGLLRGDPPHQVVVGHEPVHVLQRHLGLADAAEPEQGLRLRQHHGHAPAELIAHPLQHDAAPGEPGVAGRRVPDLRDGPREAGTGLRGTVDAVGQRHGPLHRAQQGGRRVHLVEPEEVHRVAVDVRRGEPYVAHPQRHQLAPAPGRVLGGRPLPHVHGPGRLEVGRGEQHHGPGGRVDADARAPEGVPGGRSRCPLGRDVLRHDPETGPGEHRLDPVGPHPVLGDVGQEQVGGQRRAAPGEGVPDAQPDLLADDRHGGDVALGDHGGEPFEGGEQRVGEPGLVAEGGQGLLVGVVGAVRDLHRAPVGGEIVPDQAVREAVELDPGQRPAGVGLLLLALVDAHRDRVDLDAPVVEPLVDLAGDGRGAVDGLVGEGEAVDQDVGEVDGADVGDVGQAGAAVDQDVVVVPLHVGA